MSSQARKRPLPQHVYTPIHTRKERYGRDDGYYELDPFGSNSGGLREQPKLLHSDTCIYCEATKNLPWSSNTYLYRFSPEKHPFSWLIQEEL